MSGVQGGDWVCLNGLCCCQGPFPGSHAVDVEPQGAESGGERDLFHATDAQASHAHLMFEAGRGGFDVGSPAVAVSKFVTGIMQTTGTVLNTFVGVLVAG